MLSCNKYKIRFLHRQKVFVRNKKAGGKSRKSGIPDEGKRSNSLDSTVIKRLDLPKFS